MTPAEIERRIGTVVQDVERLRARINDLEAELRRVGGNVDDRVDDLISAVKRHVDTAIENLDGAIRTHVEASLGPHGAALARLPEMMTLLEEARDERVYRRKREEEAALERKNRKDNAELAAVEAEAASKRWKGRALIIAPAIGAVATIAIEAIRSYAH